MNTEHLLTNIAIILLSAFLGGLLFRRFNQSIVVGYLLSGILIGPYGIGIFKRPDCPVCQGKIEKSTGAAERLAWLCGRNTVNINPPEPLSITLDDVYEMLKQDFKILVKTSFAVVFEYDGGVEASLFDGGRMLIKNVKSEKAALDVYDAITRKLRARS